ncbi:MAG: winged helix-turn-helix transcriptional regulator [Planctomycetaceae bacterium]|nr:winged helix-turn-helix transcriptional regulator [Planctomycetaceae bacterium]
MAKVTTSAVSFKPARGGDGYSANITEMADEAQRGQVAQDGLGSPEISGEGFDAIQVSDQAILSLMRTNPATSILDLAERLAVTDTAVRQRLARLMDRGMVERFAVREGRGRPKHVYRLTEAGQRASGANLDDLAVAFWQELVALDDVELRERLLRSIVGRLTARYAPEVFGQTPEQRLKSVVDLFNRRGIPFAFERVGNSSASSELSSESAKREPLGRLMVLGCPYPGLKDQHRLVCRMEQMLFQSLIGVPMQDVTDSETASCCSFVPLGSGTSSRPSSATESGQMTGSKGSCGKSRCDCH